MARYDSGAGGWWVFIPLGIAAWVLWKFATGWAFWGPVIAIVIAMTFTDFLLKDEARGDGRVFKVGAGVVAGGSLGILMWAVAILWLLHSACTSM